MSLFADDMVSYINNPRLKHKRWNSSTNSLKLQVIKSTHRNQYVSIHLFLWRTVTNLYCGTESGYIDMKRFIIRYWLT